MSDFTCSQLANGTIRVCMWLHIIDPSYKVCLTITNQIDLCYNKISGWEASIGSQAAPIWITLH